MAGSEDAFLERVVKGVRARERLGPEADQELMNGDMISLEEPVKAENVKRVVRIKKKPKVVKGEGEGSCPADDFVPFPELASDQRQSSGSRKSQNFRDLKVLKVIPQEARSVGRVSMDTVSSNAFCESLDPETHRCALLYGCFNNLTKEVKVEVIFEPRGEANAKGPDYDDMILYNPDPQVKKLTAALGLVPVGWIFTHSYRESFLTAHDVVVASKLQIAIMKEYGREIGSSFVTVAVNMTKGGVEKDGLEMEGYQISDHGVQIFADGLIIDQKENRERGALTTSRPFLVESSTANEIDTAWVTLAVPILAHKGIFKTAEGPLTSMPELSSRLFPEDEVTTPFKLSQRLSDFNVLLYVSHFLGEGDLNKLCRAIMQSKKGKKGKEGAKPLSQSFVVLFQAMCQEDDNQ